MDEEITRTSEIQSVGFTKRENAWRVFAAEFNDSTYAFQNEDKSVPNYVLTPLGAKINRLYFIGVVTEVENIGSGAEPMYRARVSDPTGVFYLSAGRFQPEAASALAALDPPEIIAVVGKARTYTPDEGGMYVSVRPEVVWKVPQELREYWLLETCKHTKTRLEAMNELYKMHEPSIDELVNLGFSRKLAEGGLKVIEQYGTVDLPKYQSILGNVLSELVMRVESPGSETDRNPVPDMVEEEPSIPSGSSGDDTGTDPVSEFEGSGQDISEGEEDLEQRLMDLIRELYNETSNGTLYQDLWEKASSLGFDRNQVEECITLLEDKGLIYEPSIGVLKLVNP
jgi:RPA family protein